jgi:5-methyltetrahydrofolate--homocysteine methyltransferase
MIVVGEKVNATRKAVKEAVEKHDAAFLAELIRSQDAAGADYIDLNVGIGSGLPAQEIADMQWLVDIALDATAKPLCIDSADPAVFKAAADRLRGSRAFMLNSAKGTPDSLDAILPIVALHQSPFVALAMDERGVAPDAETRLTACAGIHDEAARRGIDPSLILFDPLVMPLSTDASQAMVTCECIRRIKERFPKSKTIIGLSNVSYGLPRRGLLNQAFLIAALASGLDAAIIDPTSKDMRRALLAGLALVGRDRHCLGFIRAHKKGLFD